ncbi:hypothetical protein EJ04DRAFT_273409 [Polyplosphaeria fusca]|uniref:Uncharacterized protein n=1 Tax=Polyplosphaeria fusca TaxID=682080 RepID=A0A9P4V1M5_9PLEO|nr:hypothetical protein EJ04DRAFT_273409 [Polyplosphaeria fusca]
MALIGKGEGCWRAVDALLGCTIALSTASFVRACVRSIMRTVTMRCNMVQSWWKCMLWRAVGAECEEARKAGWGRRQKG